MSPLHAFNKLLEVPDFNNANITLAFVRYVEDGSTEFRSINISQDVGREFCEMCKKFMHNYVKLKADGDLRLHEFTGGYKPDDHEVEYLSLDKALINTIVDSIPSVTDIQLMDKADGFIDNVRFYMVLLMVGKQKLMFFRRYSRSKELTKSKNVFIRLMGDRYELLKEPTFQFDDKFDVLVYDGYLFSLNKHNFQYIFKFYEMMRESAEKCLKTIEASIPIANFDRFEAACLTHLQKLAKLRNIASKPYLSKVTMGDLRRTIERFQLPIDIIYDNGEEKLKYDDSDKWVILNLLDDAYLGSEMTGIKYEANSKREL